MGEGENAERGVNQVLKVLYNLKIKRSVWGIEGEGG